MNHVPKLVEVLSLRKKLCSVRVGAAELLKGYCPDMWDVQPVPMGLR
jgi:hypothetical protein